MRALVVSLLLLTIADGLLTLLLIDSHREEYNPVMAYLIKMDGFWFILGKYALTAACVPALVIWKNHRLFGTPFKVKYLIPLFVALYTALTTAQVWAVACPHGPKRQSEAMNRQLAASH